MIELPLCLSRILTIVFPLSFTALPIGMFSSLSFALAAKTLAAFAAGGAPAFPSKRAILAEWSCETCGTKNISVKVLEFSLVELACKIQFCKPIRLAQILRILFSDKADSEDINSHYLIGHCVVD